MKVTLERLPESRVQLDIEVDPERLEKSLDGAYRRVSSKAKIPGFRPGKAPRHVVERMVGREGLIREALDRLVPDVYNEALATEAVDAIDQPDIEIVDLEPVRFKATVPVRPNVDLGDYLAQRVEREPVAVAPAMIDEQILHLRRRHAIHAPVERGAQWNDFVTASIRGEGEDGPFVEDDAAEFPLREGQTLFLPGLAEAILGMTRDEEKVVELAVPEDFQVERMRGKTATLTLKISEIKEEQLPDEDDDFAAQVNVEEFPTYAALRERIEKDIREGLDRDARSRLRTKAVDQLVETATLEYPKVLVEREITRIINESVGNNQQAYSQHLARIGKDEADFRELFREAAESRVRRSLVIVELAEREGVDVTTEEIDAAVGQLTEPLGDEADRFRQLFTSEAGVATVRRNVLTEKTLARLEEIVTADGGSAATVETEPSEAEAEAPAKKPARRKKSE